MEIFIYPTIFHLIITLQITSSIILLVRCTSLIPPTNLTTLRIPSTFYFIPLLNAIIPTILFTALLAHQIIFIILKVLFIFSFNLQSLSFALIIPLSVWLILLLVSAILRIPFSVSLLLIFTILIIPSTASLLLIFTMLRILSNASLLLIFAILRILSNVSLRLIFAILRILSNASLLLIFTILRYLFSVSPRHILIILVFTSFLQQSFITLEFPFDAWPIPPPISTIPTVFALLLLVFFY